MKKKINIKEVPVVGRLRTCIQKAKSENLKNKTIIDVGCSNGLLAHYLISEKPTEYFGVDPNPKAIEEAKKNIKGRVKFEISTAANLPVKENYADVALMFDVIEHVPQGTELEALKEVCRVLKKNGTLLLSTPNDHPLTNILDIAWYLGHRHYKPKRIKKLLEDAGFKNITIEVLGGIWFSIYLILLYIIKWIGGNPNPRIKFLEKLDDQQFDKNGIHTIFVKAVK